MRITFSLTIFILIFSFQSFCQAQGEAIIARVADAKSNQPIPFASVKIWVNNRLFGVVTNSDGAFQIPGNYRNRIDSLIISCIGYANRSINKNQLLSREEIIILLSPASVQLSEVTVKAKHLAASRIVELAIQNISKNYPQQPYSYVGYYRDYQMKDKEYLNLNEAIIDVNDKGFSSNDFSTTTLKLYKYEEKGDFRRDSSMAIPYDKTPENKWTPTTHLESAFGGNEFSILRIHDAIRNYNRRTYSFVDILSVDFIDNHYFKLIETVYINNTPLYHISFHSISTVSRADFAKGELFIERSNFAIHKFTYSFFNRTIAKPTLLFDIQLEYTKRESLMYLNYISVNNLFKVRTTPFNITEIVFDTIKYSLELTLNKVPLDPNSLLNTLNYHFTFHNKDIRVNSIKMVKPSKTKFRLYFKRKDLRIKNTNDMTSEFKMRFTNIRDENNVILNDILDLSIYQFREFFLQKLSKKNDPEEKATIISKEKPLSKAWENPHTTNVSGYWMNTPLRSK